MKSRHEERRLAVSNAVANFFGIIMVVLYIVLGTTIISNADEQRTIPRQYAVFFGVALILYGVFRAYKVYRNYVRRDEEL